MMERRSPERIVAFVDEDFGGRIFVMFNPHITAEDGAFDTAEGCLSLQGERRTVRYQRIEVDYMDRKFRERHAAFTGFTAQIIQHEIDHCDGVNHLIRRPAAHQSIAARQNSQPTTLALEKRGKTKENRRRSTYGGNIGTSFFSVCQRHSRPARSLMKPTNISTASGVSWRKNRLVLVSSAVTAAISSSLSVKSNTSMFCSIRSRCVDLGNATMFRCTSQRRIT